MNHYTMRKILAKKVRELYFQGISERDIEIIVKEEFGASKGMIIEFIEDAKFLFNKAKAKEGIRSNADEC